MNIRLRYNPAEGIDLYIVYNEGSSTELEESIYSFSKMYDRSILIKYNYTFRL